MKNSIKYNIKKNKGILQQAFGNMAGLVINLKLVLYFYNLSLIES